MSQAVLISIRPKWCELIASGQKTVEVRKTRPKLHPPFKCYIYCTKAQTPVLVALQNPEESPLVMTCGTGTRRYPVEDTTWARLLNGTVCGEFTCDHIYQYTTMAIKDGTDICDEEMERLSCLTHRELADYEASSMKEEGLWYFGLYGWHIADLKIYDEPKELSEFGVNRAPQSWRFINDSDKRIVACLKGRQTYTREMCWCYVEELQ